MALSLKHKQQPEYRMNEKMDRTRTKRERKSEIKQEKIVQARIT